MPSSTSTYATLDITLNADKSLAKNGLSGSIWSGYSNTECVEGVSITSPFTADSSKALAEATVDSGMSCWFDDSNIEFNFYSDSAKKTRVGWAKFHEGCGTGVWKPNGQSDTFYPSSTSYGYQLVVSPGATANKYSLTIQAAPPASTAALTEELDGGFAKAFEALKSGSSEAAAQPVNLGNVVEAFSSARPGPEDVEEMRECYPANRDVIRAAVVYANKMLATPEGLARVRNLEKLLTTTDHAGLDGKQLVRDMVDTPELVELIQVAQPAGIKAIGFGVAASFSLVLAGVEKGIEGLLIMPQNSGGSKLPFQATSRSWTFATGGVDALASAGIELSFWSTTPKSQAIVGFVVDVTVLAGVRFTYIKTTERPDKVTRPVQRPDATYAGFSLRLGVGLEIGGGLFAGGQLVPAGKSPTPPTPPHIPAQPMTLYVDNAATNTPVIQIGKTATLNVTLISPQGGQDDPLILSTNKTTITMTFPDFLQDDVSSMTVQNLTGWTPSVTSSGSLQLTYTGANNTPWKGSLVFSIAAVSSSSTTPQKGQVKVAVDGTNSKRQAVTTAPLDLVALVFYATLDWTVGLPDGFEIGTGCTGEGTTCPPGPVKGVKASSPPTDFQLLTKVKDKNNVTWNLGYFFLQVDNGQEIVPVMEAAWWKDGTPAKDKNMFTATAEINEETATVITAYWNDVQNGAAYLQITATLLPSP